MKPTLPDLLYHVVEGIPLYLDLYHSAIRPAPLTIYLHAGGFTAGNRKDHAPQFTQLMLNAGYAVASIDYRLSPRYRWPAAVEDAQAALAFLRMHGAAYGLSSSRIGAWGHSAGGHLAAWLGAVGAVNTVVDFYGSTDLAAFADYTTELADPAMNAQVNRDVFGAELGDVPDLVRHSNPATHLGAHSAPMLLIHGRQDGVVPPDQSERLYRALQKAQIESELLLLDDAGHDVPDNRVDEVAARMIAFFNRHLMRNERR